MTYGFKFLNNSNERIIDDSSVKPWFLEQAVVLGTSLLDPAYYANLLNQTDGEGNQFSSFVPAGSGITSWAVYTIRYATPAAYKGFLIFNLPNTSKQIYYESQDPSNVSSYSEVTIRAYVPNTVVATAADIPKAYMFIGNAIPNSQLGTGYGVQIFNQAAECMFDSNKRHLQPAQYPYIPISNLSSKYNTSNPLGPAVTSEVSQLILDANYAMPSNPAFLLPGINRSYIMTNTGAPSGTWYNTYIPTLYKKVFNSGDLLIAEPSTFRLPASAPDAPGMFGPTAGLTRTIVVNATPLDQGYTPGELPQSFILTKNTPSIQESQGGLYTTFVITIYLTTAGVPNGTVVPYRIVGTNITASDFTSGTLTGNFAVTNNSATISLTATNDGLIEGTETATLELLNGMSSVSFTITDAISYSLSSFMTPEEGQSITVTLITQGLANGSTVPYTITGITQADLTVGTITGNFTISSNTSGLEFRFARDASTENETMRISVNNGATFLDIPITDVPAGNEVLNISPQTFNYNERTTISLTGGAPNTSFEFLNVAQGVDPVYAWNNRWKPEYASTVGTAYFDENGNFYNPPYTALGPTGSDLGGNPNSTVNRTFWIFTTYTKNFRSFSYTINPTQTFSITGSNGTKGPLTISETSTGYFKVTTTNVPTGTMVYPKFINGTLDIPDYTNSAANGVAIGSDGIANFSIQFTADQSTEGSETGELVVQYPNGFTKDSYGVITVLDVSQTPAGYSVTRSAASINEGAYIIFTIGLTSVPSGTQLWWDISGTGITANDVQYVYHDSQDGNGWFTPSGGSALNNTFTVYGQTVYQVILYLRNDLDTEGTETATFNLRTGYSGGQSQASTSFTINDTSTAPAYNESVTIVSDANGNYIVPLNGYMTITVGPGAPNTGFTYAITNNNDPQPTSFPGVATLDGSGYFYNYITGATFQGSQTVGDKRLWAKFNYNNNVRSARANIVYDAGTASGGEYCSGTTRYQNYNDGVGGVYAQVVATNSALCGYVQQYTPYRTMVTYTYYNFDYQGDTWGMNGGRPGGAVTATIINGPYAGFALSGSFDGNGYYRQVVGNYGYLSPGFYTLNFTFPGQDAYYASNYRTIVAYFYVIDGSSGSGGVIP
jgi:hypothetical protein